MFKRLSKLQHCYTSHAVEPMKNLTTTNKLDCIRSIPSRINFIQELGNPQESLLNSIPYTIVEKVR